MLSNSSLPLKVLFLLQRPEAWPNVASVWEEMSKNPAFEPTIWLLPYNVKEINLNEEKLLAHKKILEKNNINYVEWNSSVELEYNMFHIAIITHPYDRERPNSLWFRNVAKKIKKIVYIPYGLSVGSGYRNLYFQYAQPTQAGASLIVARSLAEKRMYKYHCPSGDGAVKVLGHPRFDYLLNNLQQTTDSGEFEEKIKGRTTILWNSHFSFTKKYYQNLCFSTFDTLGPDIFKFFIKYNNIFCLIWRPHPILFTELIEEEIISKSDLLNLKEELKSIGIILDQEADHIPAFHQSDAMLSDPGSFLFEYLATKKPFLPLMNTDGEPLNEEADELIQVCGSAKNFTEVEEFLINLIEGKLNLKIFHQLQLKHIPHLDGKSGQRLCSELLGIPPSFTPLILEDKYQNKNKFIQKKFLVVSNKNDISLNEYPNLKNMLMQLEILKHKRFSENLPKKIIRRIFYKLKNKMNFFIKNIISK